MDLQTLLTKLLTFGNNVIIPFLMAVAFFVFVWNAVRYFIIGGANEDDQEKARSLATWGIVAFVIMVSMWGIVNTLVKGLNLDRPIPVTPDYLQEKGGAGNLPWRDGDNY